MPAPISNIPTPQLALNNRSNVGTAILPIPTGGMSRVSNSPTPVGAMSRVPATPTGSMNTLQGAMSHVPPSTPVKKTTVNNVDGSSTSTEYHAPIAPVAPPPPATSAAPAAQPSQTPPSNTTSFPGIVSGLASTAVNGSQNAAAATQGLLNAPNQNAQISQEAQGIKDQYGNAISKISNYGNALAGSYTNGAGLAPVSQGLAGQAQQTTAAEVAGQQAAEEAALAPLATELTAQNQGQSGLTNAGSIANTQQTNEQSGLASAGSLAAPTSNFPFKFDPLTGSFTNASTGATGALTYNPTTDAATLAKEVINGNIPYSDAVTAMGYAPNGVGTGALQQAIVQGGGNIAQLQGQAAGQQAVGAAGGQATASNIQTSGTAATTGTAASLQGTIKTYNDMSSLNTTANAQATTVQQVLKDTGLNQGVPAFTKPLNTLAGQLGSDKVTALTSAVTEMQNVYSQLLSSGGTTPSGSEAQALALLSPSSTPQQINSAIEQLQTAAYNKLNGQYSQLQTEQNALGTSNTNSNASSNPTGWF